MNLENVIICAVLFHARQINTEDELFRIKKYKINSSLLYTYVNKGDLFLKYL